MTTRSAVNSRWYRLEQIYGQQSKKLGKSSSTISVILNISYQPSGCTQSELMARTLLPKQTINSIVKSLRKEGLVELQTIPTDRRIKNIFLTSQGKKFVKQELEPASLAEQESLESLTPAEQRQFLTLFDRYLDALENHFRRLN